MFTALEKGICSLAVFIICAQTIVHFRPKASYEKYLKILVSIFILMQLLQAVETVFSGQARDSLLQQTKECGESLQKDLTQSVEQIWNLPDSAGKLLGELVSDEEDNPHDLDSDKETGLSNCVDPVTVPSVKVHVDVDPITSVTP